MELNIKFNEEKNEILRETRGVSFEAVIKLIESNTLVDDLAHTHGKHANQRIAVVFINNYTYAVPYVINLKKKEIFLKTIYPSRLLHAKYKKVYSK